jgi:hypothetical protein
MLMPGGDKLSTQQANSRSATQEIPCPLWKPKGSLSHSKEHTHLPYPLILLNIHYSIILPNV